MPENTTARRLLRLLTSQPMQDTSKAFNRFYYACALDDLDAAYRFLPLAAALRWGDCRGSDTVRSSISGISMLDVTAMSSRWIDRLPRKYFLALLRASRLRLQNKDGSRHTSAYTWEEVADEFERQVLAQGKPSRMNRAEAC